MAELKLVCISDLHGYLPAIPPCDILLVAGDICPAYNHSLDFQSLWIRTNLVEWRTQQPAKHCIFCAGNHDFIFQKTACGLGYHHEDYGMLSNPTWLCYAEDEVVDCCGLKIYSSPWQKLFGGWAFNLEEKYMQEKWAKMPDDVDIILSHGPPYSYGDDVSWENYDGSITKEKTGSLSFTKRIIEVQPKLVVFGHIHSGYGKYQLGSTVLLNASYVNDNYRPVNKPWEITLNANN
jgi:Icc-related predicted phosphoesterase